MAGPSGATARLALPYPTPDDSVDVPRDVKALADKLDGGSSVPLLVSALPSNPVDGQECYYRVASDPWPIWHLRFNASWGGTSKWEFLGGSPLEQYVAAEAGGGNVVFADIPGGPSFTIPLAGDYRVTVQAEPRATATVAFLWAIQASIPGFGAMAQANFATGPAGSQTFTRTALHTVQPVASIPADSAIRMQGYMSGVGCAFALRYLAVTPVRVG